MCFESTVPMHPQLRPFTRQLFLDFCAICFPEWPLIFFVIMIHQVIWPSPGTLLRTQESVPDWRTGALPSLTELIFSFFLSWVSKTQPNHWTKLIERTPPPPGGFPITVPSSRTVGKRDPLEEFVPGSSRGVLLLTVLDGRT